FTKIQSLNHLTRFELFDFNIPDQFDGFIYLMRRILMRETLQHFTIGPYTTSLEPYFAHNVITDLLSALNPSQIRRLSMHLVHYKWMHLLSVFHMKPALLSFIEHLDLKIGDMINCDQPEVYHEMPMELLQYICDKATNLKFLHFSIRDTVCTFAITHLNR